MFNLFFRRYVPGFRVGLDGVPGFNIDDNGLPQRASASSDGTLPDSAAQQYPDVAQTQSPPSISFRPPGAEGWVLSAPLIGSPGFRVSPQDVVPGFNVGSQDDAPGFNVDEKGGQQQETTWSYGLPPESVTPQDPITAQTPTPAPDVDDPTPPAPPLLPEWPYQLGTMPPPRLPTTFDPRTGPRIEINAPPGVGSATAPGADRWPTSSAPQHPADIAVRSRAATTQNVNPQAVAQQAMRTAWLQPPKDVWPYIQGDGALRAIPLVRPLGDSSSSLANAGDVGGQKAQQPMPLQQYQQTQRTMPSTPLGAGLTTVRLPEKQNINMTGLEPRSDQEFSQLIEAYRRLKEVEGRQPISGQPSPQPPLNEDGISSYAPGSDGPSLGQRLVQSSVETIVPGAHYQELARQQLGAGNYVGAGAYQAAALLDAALGIATFGLSTRLAAAGRTAAAEGAALFRRAFDSRSQLLRYLGRAPEGMQWHHIVEQSQAGQFGQRPIQSVENIVAIPIEAHQWLNAFYSSKQYFSKPNTVREWLRRQSFEKQYEYGMDRLKQVLGY
ncbi:MAG TPA: hypothetical protein VK729_07375 [Silvibacterium sp.]|nr:hypothetical protein [Silvibacterium sp.]